MAPGIRRYALLAGLSWSALTASAHAQEVSEDPSAGEPILVTGSRIAKTTFETATPVTVVSQAALEAKAPTSTADLIRDIPSLRPNQNNQQATDVGASTFNMRSLGAQRTLVLIDGRRAMDTSPTGGFDMNILPAPLIRRVDIVTAGASSVYGSDAVTGVVNVFLDSKLEA